MPSDEIAISVKNLTKKYRIFGHPGDRIKQALTFGRVRFHREFTALQDVSFEIKKGETVGIIGRNGSGKSTLLQLICGILKPTSGTVQVNGRVSALLELGAGFNPEFTGRENVYFQGAVMGLTKEEMDERFDVIAAFAEIGEFIDQPVRTYSSGMFVRLAFAVAVSVEPDVLVVDEALAVGDSGFQAKCFRRMQEMCDGGVTILFVTHDMDQIIQMCRRALFLDEGTLLGDGQPNGIANRYLDSLFTHVRGEKVSERPSCGHVNEAEHFHLHPAYHSGEYRWGNGGAAIQDFVLRQNGLDNPPVLESGMPVELSILVSFHQSTTHPVFGLALKSKQGAILFGANSDTIPDIPDTLPRSAGEVLWAIFTFTPWLHSGDYFLSVGVVEICDQGILPLDRRYDSIRFSVRHSASQAGPVAMNPGFSFLDSP
ncbi:MAG: ABC transporter ATP-binding protein [Sulfuricella sp.]|nr:ABC transporter ATP-binding protein [Sulfuricella sp.]